MSLAFVENYKAVRARLNNPPRVKELVYREVKKLPTVSEIVSSYRVAFDSEALPPKPKTAKEIIAEVCELRHVTRTALMSGRRFKQIVDCRHEIMWRLREETSLSFPQIGRLLGGMDHSSVISGARRHGRRIAGEIRP